MGQHTWFVKSLELYNEQQSHYETLDSFDEGNIFLDENEIFQIEARIYEIEELNKTNYHDLFRSGKRDDDDTYIEDIITSKDQCFEWINNPDNKISFKNVYNETDEQEQINKKRSIEMLNKFWDQYPNGVIYFG